MSIAHCIVAPMPTAGPLQAEITGLRHSKIRKVIMPPPSRGIPGFFGLVIEGIATPTEISTGTECTT